MEAKTKLFLFHKPQSTRNDRYQYSLQRRKKEIYYQIG